MRYVDAILEATGLLKKGHLNPKGPEKIRRMEDRQIRTFADTLQEQVQDLADFSFNKGCFVSILAILIATAFVPSPSFIPIAEATDFTPLRSWVNIEITTFRTI